jgi:hypothetical protein
MSTYPSIYLCAYGSIHPPSHQFRSVCKYVSTSFHVQKKKLHCNFINYYCCSCWLQICRGTKVPLLSLVFLFRVSSFLSQFPSSSFFVSQQHLHLTITRWSGTSPLSWRQQKREVWDFPVS